jgi:hypothetical protein
VVVDAVGTADQLTDILIKPLARVRFAELRGKIGLVQLTSKGRLLK